MTGQSGDVRLEVNRWVFRCFLKVWSNWASTVGQLLSLADVIPPCSRERERCQKYHDFENKRAVMSCVNAGNICPTKYQTNAYFQLVTYISFPVFAHIAHHGILFCISSLTAVEFYFDFTVHSWIPQLYYRYFSLLLLIRFKTRTTVSPSFPFFSCSLECGIAVTFCQDV